MIADGRRVASPTRQCRCLSVPGMLHWVAWDLWSSRARPFACVLCACIGLDKTPSHDGNYHRHVCCSCVYVATLWRVPSDTHASGKLMEPYDRFRALVVAWPRSRNVGRTKPRYNEYWRLRRLVGRGQWILWWR